MLILILQFFRNPKIDINSNENYILSPVDGKVVIIEEVCEPEFLKIKDYKLVFSCLRLMYTLLDIQWVVILYSLNIIRRLFSGMASEISTKNERTTIVLENNNFGKYCTDKLQGHLQEGL